METKQLTKFYRKLKKLDAIQFLGACRVLGVELFTEIPTDRPLPKEADFSLIRPTEDLIVDLTTKFLDLNRDAKKRFLKILSAGAAKKSKPKSELGEVIKNGSQFAEEGIPSQEV